MMLLRKILPLSLKRTLRTKLTDLQRPRMIWGYKSPKDFSYYPNVRISSSTYLYHAERIQFSDDVFVWHYTILDGTGGIKIGKGTQIGAWVGIFTHSSHIAIRILGDRYRSVPANEKPAFSIAPVEIGEYVFIAAGAKVLPGVTIGSYSLLSALTVVTRDIPPHSVVAGNPGKVVGSTLEMDRKAISQLSETQMALLDPYYMQMLQQE